MQASSSWGADGGNMFFFTSGMKSPWASPPVRLLRMVALLLVLLPLQLYAQTEEFGGVLFEGEVVARVGAGTVQRDALALRGGIEIPVGRSSFFADVEIEQRSFTVEGELRDRFRFDCMVMSPPSTTGDCAPTREIKVEQDAEAVIDELNYRLYLSDQLELIMGRQNLSWGQFQLLSPINFLLPQSTSPSVLGLTRETLQFAQDSVQLRFFPIDRVEIQLVQSSGIRVDPLLLEVGTTDANGRRPDNTPEVSVSRFSSHLEGRKDITALRALYFADWGVVGVTYYDGAVWFQTLFEEEVSLKEDNNVPVNITDLNLRTPDSLGPNGFLGGLPDAEAFGIELSVDIGKNWNFLAEITRTDTRGNPFGIFDTSFAPASPQSPPREPALIELAQELIARNKGLVALDVTNQLLAFGLEKVNLGDVGWSYSLQLLQFSQDWGSDYDNLYQRLAMQAEVDDQDGNDPIFVPGVYLINRHYVFDRPGSFTLGTGMFGDAAGVVGLWNIEVSPDLSVELSLEAVSRVSEEDAVESSDNTSDQRYQLSDAISPSIGVGVSYRF